MVGTDDWRRPGVVAGGDVARVVGHGEGGVAGVDEMHAASGGCRPPFRRWKHGLLERVRVVFREKLQSVATLVRCRPVALLLCS